MTNPSSLMSRRWIQRRTGFARSIYGSARQELTTLWFPELAGEAEPSDEDRPRLLSDVVNRSWIHCRCYWAHVNPCAINTASASRVVTASFTPSSLSGLSPINKFPPQRTATTRSTPRSANVRGIAPGPDVTNGHRIRSGVPI